MIVDQTKMILILGIFAVVLIIFNIFSTQAIGQYNCHTIQKQNEYIVQSTQRAEKSLPTISYYREHPSELQAQMKILKAQEKRFQPVPCASILNPFPR